MEVAIGRKDKFEIFGDDYSTEDGTGVRDYIHVSDLARAHVLGLEYVKKNNISLVINLGSDHGISVNQMLNEVRKVTHKEIPSKVTGRRPGDPAALYASSKKAKAQLGWVAEKSDLHTLVESTWKVYKPYDQSL